MKTNNPTNIPRVKPDHSRAPLRAEQKMLSDIRLASLICMLAAPLLIDGLLRAVNVYVDTYLAVFYPTTAVVVLQWILYYLLMILSYVYQSASYGILGYSVMRYGVKKSGLPIILILVSATVSYAAGILEFLYLSGTTSVKSNLIFYVSYWALNYLLSLFTCLCLIFLCAFLRYAFQRNKRTQKPRQSFRQNPLAYTAGKTEAAQMPDGDTRLHVEITAEDAAARRQNVLRRLYLWMTALLFGFRFLPSVANMVTEIREVGAPGDIWDVITLLQPLAEITLLSALGYFVMLYIGSVLTERNAAAKEASEHETSAA